MLLNSSIDAHTRLPAVRAVDAAWLGFGIRLALFRQQPAAAVAAAEVTQDHELVRCREVGDVRHQRLPLALILPLVPALALLLLLALILPLVPVLVLVPVL